MQTKTDIASTKVPFLPPDMTEEQWEAYVSPLTLQQKNCIDTQDRFLRAYTELGTLEHAAATIPMTSQAADWWIKYDMHYFRARFEIARRAHVARVERIVYSRLDNPQGNRGSDILLIATMNALKPETWRRDTVVIGADVAKQVLDGLRELGERARAARQVKEADGEALPAEASAVEKVARALGPGGGVEQVDEEPGREAEQRLGEVLDNDQRQI